MAPSNQLSSEPVAATQLGNAARYTNGYHPPEVKGYSQNPIPVFSNGNNNRDSGATTPLSMNGTFVSKEETV